MLRPEATWIWDLGRAAILLTPMSIAEAKGRTFGRTGRVLTVQRNVFTVKESAALKKMKFFIS